MEVIMKCEEKDLFYNMDNATADMDYWCQFTWLTKEQLTALSLDKNPDLVTLDAVKQLIQRGINTEFTHTYMNRYRLIEQASLGLPRNLGNEFELRKFIAWAIENRVSIPGKMKCIFNDKEKNITTNDIESDKIGCTSRLEESPYWKKIEGLCKRAIEEFPAYKKSNGKIKKTNHLKPWLRKTFQTNDRESDFIIKILTDIFQI